MIDPITAIAGATAAFNTLKKGIQVGKDLQDMGGTMAKWACAIADLDFADRQNQRERPKEQGTVQYLQPIQ